MSTETHKNGKLPRPEIHFNAERKKQPVTYDPIMAGDIAKLALHLVIASDRSVPDGETSTGNQKYRQPTPEEVVARAIALAELTFETLAAKGHVVFAPPFDELPNESGPVGFKG
jgi:hypothetical protein